MPTSGPDRWLTGFLPTNSTLLSCPTRGWESSSTVSCLVRRSEGDGVRVWRCRTLPAKIRDYGRLLREARSPYSFGPRLAARHAERMPLTKPMSDAGHGRRRHSA